MITDEKPKGKIDGLSSQLSSRYIKDTFNYSPATLIPSFMAVISTMFFTRMFTSTEYGIFSAVLAITGPTTILLTEWLGQSTGRFYAEYKIKGELPLYLSTISKCLQVVFLVSLGISTFFLFIGNLNFIAGLFG